MNLQALQKTLREFAAERHWQPFHTPKNLSTALMVEAAELAEIFQWMTPEASQAAQHDPATKEHIADEVADVLLYLLQLADHCAIDIPQAVASKLVKNAVKHPAARLATPQVKVPESAPLAKATSVTEHVDPNKVENSMPPPPQTHVLVDWENVQPKDQDIQALVPSVTDVWLFHGPNQKNVALNQTLFGQRATLVPITRAGNNALDFHLSFYMGYIASRNPQANFVVVSNDKGYLPMLEHAQILGFSVRQTGFVKGLVVAPKSAPRKVTTKAKVAVAVTPASTQKLKTWVRPFLDQTDAPKSMGTKSTKAPTRQQAATHQNSLSDQVGQAVERQASVTPVSADVPLSAALIKPAKKTAPLKKAPVAKKAAVAVKAAKASPKTKASAGKPAVAPAPASLKLAQKKPLVPLDLDKAVRHVQASLQKTANKPARKARLLAMIKSLLNLSTTDAPIVSEVLVQLVGNGFVGVDENGAVRFNA